MLMVVVSMVVVMMVVVVMRKYHAILIHVAELLALILARERAKEGYDSGNLIIINIYIRLVASHVAYRLIHRQACAIVVVGPCKLDIA